MSIPVETTEGETVMIADKRVTGELVAEDGSIYRATYDALVVQLVEAKEAVVEVIEAVEEAVDEIGDVIEAVGDLIQGDTWLWQPKLSDFT